MALIGNNSVYFKSPCRYFAGSGALSCIRSNWNNNGSSRNIFTQAASSETDYGGRMPQCNSIPNGYGMEAWTVPISDGGMATKRNITGSGTITASIVIPVSEHCSLTGSGTIIAGLVLGQNTTTISTNVHVRL